MVRKKIVKSKKEAKDLLESLDLIELEDESTSTSCEHGQTDAVVGVDKKLNVQIIIGICDICGDDCFEYELDFVEKRKYINNKKLTLKL